MKSKDNFVQFLSQEEEPELHFGQVHIRFAKFVGKLNSINQLKFISEEERTLNIFLSSVLERIPKQSFGFPGLVKNSKMDRVDQKTF